MDGIVRESLLRPQMRQSCRLWIGVMIAVTLVGSLQAAEPATTRPTQPRAGQVRPTGGAQPSSRPAAGQAGERNPARSHKVDHAVLPAGGAATGQARCSQCQRAACPQCRLPDPQQHAHAHAHAHCQHGLCPAHCPVRPDVFGFYGTQWRRWPGSGVVQASNNEAATPARPPLAEVPGAEEESLVPDAAAADLPAPAAVDPEASDRSSPAEESDEVVSLTAWRTFTATPPRLAVQR